MARLIFSIGIPGSGKTTILKKFAETLSAEYISPDSIRLEKYGSENDHSDDKEIWVIARARVADAIKLDRTIVFDSTFSAIKRRQHFITFVRSCSTKIIIEGLYFKIPLDLVLKRNEGRSVAGNKVASSDYIKTAYTELENNPPKPEEGFDVLIQVDEVGNFSDCTHTGSMFIEELRALSQDYS